jgi:hypothetical protein
MGPRYKWSPLSPLRRLRCTRRMGDVDDLNPRLTEADVKLRDVKEFL